MSSNQERVVLLTTAHNTAAEKLDYFILGVSLAICAYLAQTNPYGRIGLNRETFLLGSLLVFAASAVFGFLRIQSTIADVRQNAFALEEQNPAISKQLLAVLSADKTSHRYYKIRNYLLGAGLLCYLTTKVWAAY